MPLMTMELARAGSGALILNGYSCSPCIRILFRCPTQQHTRWIIMDTNDKKSEYWEIIQLHLHSLILNCIVADYPDYTWTLIRRKE